MTASDPQIIHDLFKFRRFRLNVLSFLRLPLDTNEQALRQAMESNSASLLADYLQRAEQARRSVVKRVHGAFIESSGTTGENGEAEGLAPDPPSTTPSAGGTGASSVHGAAALAFNQITQRIDRRPVSQRSSPAVA